jgi:hypothetical protein
LRVRGQRRDVSQKSVKEKLEEMLHLLEKDKDAVLSFSKAKERLTFDLLTYQYS